MEYFTISELIRSDTAIKRKIWNGATLEEEENLRALVSAVLDPARRAFGKAIKVTSGFRCAAVNKNIGVAGSQHLNGEAADIVSAGAKGRQMLVENYTLGRLIVALGKFDQIIFENVSKDDLLPEWIHVSWKRKGDNRGSILKKVKGGKVYVQISRKELNL